MQSEELSEALNELEQRVERLRALYEQYFMGIEKIEPTVQRKDVDRRFWVLRREQIRNTAQRFKLNTINQRYNTYSQYWQRCMREIEAGTYRRHLVKAEKRFGAEALTIASRKRLGRKQETDLKRRRKPRSEHRKRSSRRQTSTSSTSTWTWTWTCRCSSRRAHRPTSASRRSGPKRLAARMRSTSSTIWRR